ncbi:MAG TPA: hypothetical protein PK986_06350 [Spirochaetota bacterium]|nr:hypothetical protein [Spirochaetota bacterium]
MEILLLFILNIFTGALIYLLLSLKIEKNSSTYQEQKLKKEMGTIITEFNSTAERNITLLEARISVLKKLMGESGTIKSMDIIMDHQPEIKTILDEKADGREMIKQREPDANASDGDRIITKNASDIAEISRAGIISGRSTIRSESKTAAEPRPKETVVENLYSRPGALTIDRSGGVSGLVARGERIDLISDDEIDIFNEPGALQVDNPVELFATAENKYSLIAELHGRGYSVEDLAAYSGLPAGEVRLVISLNK